METPLEKVAKVLNEAYTADPDALHSLLCARTPFHAVEFAETHPTIQFGPSLTGTQVPTLSLLGLLNGCVGEPDQAIAMVWKDSTDTSPRTFVGFSVVKVGEAHAV